MWSLLTAILVSRGRVKLCKGNNAGTGYVPMKGPLQEGTLAGRSANRANYQSIASTIYLQ
jgi:hypothetical protein